MFPSDWRSRSLDVRQHPNFSKNCLLAAWELKLAEPLNKSYLSKFCECHIAERLECKYFLIGVHFLTLLMVASHHPDIVVQILQFVNFTQLAKVAIYLPLHARQYIANTKGLLQRLAHSYNYNLNISRLHFCLTQRDARLLYSELESLEPFAYTQQLNSLNFCNRPLSDASFNPKRSIIACVSDSSLLCVYNFETSEILLHESASSTIRKISWSPNGHFLYIIVDNVLLLIYYFVTRRRMKLLTTLPIHNEMTSSKLWFSDNSILFREPDQPKTHLCCIYVFPDGTWKKGPLEVRPLDKHPLDFPCLNAFNNIELPTCIKDFPNYIFFKVSCPYKNPKRVAHDCIIVLDLAAKSIVQIFHSPGPIYNITCSESMLVFCFNSPESGFSEMSILNVDFNQECMLPSDSYRFDKLTLAALDPRTANLQLRNIENG